MSKLTLVCVACLVGSLSLIGCGGSTATVSGKVIFKGEPLPSGVVAFQGDKGWVGNSNINSGVYEIKGIPVGDVKITVQTFQPSPSVVPPNTPPSEVALPSQKFIEIPFHYADFQSSPLRFVPKAGRQTHDIQLEESGP